MTVKLKCSVPPKSAKNIIVGKEYEGTLVDARGEVVDAVGAAQKFRCVNERGVAAEYNIALFEEIVTQLPLENVVIVLNGRNNILRIGRFETVFTTDLNAILTVHVSNNSCGTRQVNHVNTLWASINSEISQIEETIRPLITDYSRAALAVKIFKQVINSTVESYKSNAGLLEFSTNVSGNSELLLSTLDEICDYHTDEFFNPNSENYIKVWLMVISDAPEDANPDEEVEEFDLLYDWDDDDN